MRVDKNGFIWMDSDSPSKTYSIAWGHLDASSSLDDKHWCLISSNQVTSKGRTKDRIIEGIVSDDGFFALETILSNDSKDILVFAPNGDVFLEMQDIKDTITLFNISTGGKLITYKAGNFIQVIDTINSTDIVNVELPVRIYPNHARYCMGDNFIEVQTNIGLYKIALDGTFLDEERWLNDYLRTSNGNDMFHVIKHYYDRIPSPTAEEAMIYAQWVEEGIKRGIEPAFMFSVSSVYECLATMWECAGDKVKATEARQKAEDYLDGFRLVDRALDLIPNIGNPADENLSQKLLSDLDRATLTPRLCEYPNYMGKLYRAKGEILEGIGDKVGALTAYRLAVNANPKAGCKKQIKRLEDSLGSR